MIAALILYAFTVHVFANDKDVAGTLNVAYANILGSGFYSIDDRKAFVLNIPFETRLYEPGDSDWYLAMLLPVTIGVLDTSRDDILDFIDSDQLQTLGFTPGIKMYIPAYEHCKINNLYYGMIPA